jgi:hypothetical protein
VRGYHNAHFRPNLRKLFPNSLIAAAILTAQRGSTWPDPLSIRLRKASLQAKCLPQSVAKVLLALGGPRGYTSAVMHGGDGQDLEATKVAPDRSDAAMELPQESA